MPSARAPGGVPLTRFAWLSIAAAVVTISMKVGAYFLTGSVGLLSDALESCVNLVAAVVALVALSIASREPDEERAYGYQKAEYFSSGTEGGLILLAAVAIIITAIRRLLNPAPLEAIGWGLVVSAAASAVNFGVSLRLREAGRKYESITLEADARHLMTDVWTSAGVIVGVGAVALTGWLWLDPVVALAVGLNIVRAGIDLVRRSALGLLDTAIPRAERDAVQTVLEKYRAQGVEWHAVRTRQAAARRFVSLHVLVPGDWTVQHGHDLVEDVERDIRAALGTVTVFTHLEPREDPRAFEDLGLDREDEPRGSARN
ncbi:MAG TPA: cation diffusion facilitator family transporter [Chloroflexota bacterium]|jgi:cation diffusion facilitator family transporter